MVSGPLLSLICHSFMVQAAPYVSALDKPPDLPPAPSQTVLSTSSIGVAATAGMPLLLAGTMTPSPTQLSSITAVDGPPTTTIEDVITSTITVTAPPQVVTVHARPKTMTKIVALLPTATSARPSATSWALPVHFTNLAPFKVTKFACGQNNVQLVGTYDDLGVSKTRSDPTSNNMTASSETHTALQLFYPQSSINPGNPNAPQGGADFYGSPLDLSQSRNVSMAYQVFFPADFSFVRGGKLPGLYGGRPGCSGGDAAEDCFSTRLMWRANGAGELYLYAPKTKQGPSVCSTPPYSDCNAAYGLSIGRGSFTFAPGSWTSVKQTVYLNTPGQQDGTFALEVNGARVMDVAGVYYREGSATSSATSEAFMQPVIRAVGNSVEAIENQQPVLISLDSPLQLGLPDNESQDGPLASAAAMDGLLEGTALGAMEQGSLVPGDAEENDDDQDVEAGDLEQPLADEFSVDFAPPRDEVPVLVDEGLAVTVTRPISIHTVVLSALLPDATETILRPASTMVAAADEVDDESKKNAKKTGDGDPVGFVGIFFSTFFGGHDAKYASPADQKTWFREFSLAINDD